ncbi:MAG: amino acid racemase [Candidatus Omnitrophica bacterium]|nr:amino acid racemase [Candidatus Omnitrophota bacterium]MDE2009843.1 amino acid racemase [Candidatus Omnitrophota bacterium]MDE2214376.1 amino acid racemase [Candidatus Omnitrophota bacterium]MDE2231125.1 amino acid racemase [Candidatus Omnitrophota bacterium]
MKHIGIIGGLSPESTVEYYQIICRRFNKKFGGLNFPQITIRSINLGELIGLFESNKWEEVAGMILNAIHDLEDAGAEFAAIAANTPHNAYDLIQRASPIKVLSIMEATADTIQKAGIKKVGLLGTKATMEYGFFQRTFKDYGIETLIPDAAERSYIDKTIWEKLSHGRIEKQDRVKHAEIITRLVEKGAEVAVLGCTELPLLIQTEDAKVPLFDTARIHATAILEYAIK